MSKALDWPQGSREAEFEALTWLLNKPDEVAQQWATGLPVLNGYTMFNTPPDWQYEAAVARYHVLEMQAYEIMKPPSLIGLLRRIAAKIATGKRHNTTEAEKRALSIYASQPTEMFWWVAGKRPQIVDTRGGARKLHLAVRALWPRVENGILLPS